VLFLPSNSLSMLIKRIKIFSYVLVLAGMMLAVGCRKDRSIDVVVTVKFMADTNIVIPGCRVEMTKSDVKVVGYTDGDGEFRQTFMQPVQLDVEAFNDTLSGFGVLTLQDYGADYNFSVYVY